VGNDDKKQGRTLLKQVKPKDVKYYHAPDFDDVLLHGHPDVKPSSIRRVIDALLNKK